MISLFILLPLYCLTVQAERGGWWRLAYLLWPLAALVDVVLNYSEWTLMFWEKPGKGQYTVTKRLSALKPNQTWKGSVARYVCPILDQIAPSGCHCK